MERGWVWWVELWRSSRPRWITASETISECRIRNVSKLLTSFPSLSLSPNLWRISRHVFKIETGVFFLQIILKKLVTFFEQYGSGIPAFVSFSFGQKFLNLATCILSSDSHERHFFCSLVNKLLGSRPWYGIKPKGPRFQANIPFF